MAGQSPEDQNENLGFLSNWLDPEAFPFDYGVSAPFLNGQGQPSGVAGAVVELTREINNFPHVFYGVRIENVYELPDVDLIEPWKAARAVDFQQTVRVELAQQNVTAQPIVQSTLIGGHSGDGGGVVHWHPFQRPYALAGGNEIRITVQRLTSYPLLSTDPEIAVLPVCHVTIVTAVYRKDMRTVPPRRIRQPGM